MDENQQKIFDLDLMSLSVPTKHVRLPDGTEIDIKAPKLEDFLEIAKLGSMLQSGKIEASQVGMVGEIITKLSELIPELKGHDLNIQQVMALIELSLSLAVPPQAQAAENGGITPVNDGEKKSSDSPEN